MNSTSNHSETLAGSLANNANTTADKAEGLLSNASSEFHNFIADVEELVKETSILTGEDLNRAKAKLNARLAQAKASAGELGGAVAKRTRHAANMTNDYVHEQPWTAVGTGAVVGLLLGFLLARR